MLFYSQKFPKYPERKRNMKITFKRVLPILLVLLLLGGCIGLYCLAVSIYDGSFNYRCTTSEESTFDISEFPGLTRERHNFVSHQGQTLVGYLYSRPEDDVAEDAVIVFAHGLGAGGQVGYMDMFDYLTGRGYYVFAYDATANDESEGEVIGGLPQGFIDLDYAINYAYTIDSIRDLPFVLMGYSWGGMSVGNALNYHPEVKAAATLAGWNKSMNLIDYRGCQMVGGVAKLLLPFASVHEYLMYGSYSFSTTMKGFKNSDCPVMIVHGALDDTIPMEYGYDAYYKVYGSDPRFTFVRYDDRTHDLLKTADGVLDLDLMAQVADFFDEALGS